MKNFIFFFVLLLIGCGQDDSTTIDDGSKSDSKESRDGSTKLSVDLGGFYDMWCVEKDPMSWPCAKRCVKFPDRSWCGVYTPYCASEEGRKEDVEFCGWWDVNDPNKQEK